MTNLKITLRGLNCDSLDELSTLHSVLRLNSYVQNSNIHIGCDCGCGGDAFTSDDLMFKGKWATDYTSDQIGLINKLVEAYDLDSSVL